MASYGPATHRGPQTTDPVIATTRRGGQGIGEGCARDDAASAAKELAAIYAPERRRLVEAIDRLGTDPLRGAALKGDLTGLRRIRVGDYRVVYELRQQELIVLVVRIAYRRAVYRR